MNLIQCLRDLDVISKQLIIVIKSHNFYFQLENNNVLGSGSGSVSREIASDIISPRFKSSHSYILHALSAALKTIINKKEVVNGAINIFLMCSPTTVLQHILRLTYNYLINLDWSFDHPYDIDH